MMSDKKLYGDTGIGERIAALLEENHESQEDLTAALREITGEKIDRSLISKWISGERAVTKVSHLTALCEHFDASANYLLFGQGHSLSIDPDVSSAMKFTGLSEESLSALSLVANEIYFYNEFKKPNQIIQEGHENAPLIDSLICKGISSIVNELQAYANLKRDIEKYIEKQKI